MPSGEHLFISDVHLGAFDEDKDREIEDRLISLIDYATDKKASLYVLGDLFDYWMEYKENGYVPEFGKRILSRFEEYNRSISPALYVTGNHDNWTFGHFRKRGFEVIPDYREFSIDDHKLLIMHGDGQFGPRDDFMRPAFHRFLRNPAFTSVYQKIFPPRLGVGIMKQFSNITRRRNHMNPNPLNKHAERILRTHDLDIMMCGHDHIPRVETFKGGTYINLGTFFHHSTMVRYINNEFTLVTWHAENQEFAPYQVSKHI
jgi:UDP-2,3-diacylglucosamine pyrophosphatase LpxH